MGDVLKEGDLITLKLTKNQADSLLKGLTIGVEIMDIIKHKTGGSDA